MRRMFCAFVITMLLSGCATWNRTFFASDLVKLSGGENKADVIKNLGGVCTPIDFQTQDGHKFEVFEFNEKPFYVGRANKAYWTPYWVYFMDDKLVKYERAEGQALLEHTKWMQDVYAMAITMDAFKGTALMPYQHNISGKIEHDVNIRDVK